MLEIEAANAVSRVGAYGTYLANYRDDDVRYQYTQLTLELQRIVLAARAGGGARPRRAVRQGRRIICAHERRLREDSQGRAVVVWRHRLRTAVPFVLPGVKTTFAELQDYAKLLAPAPERQAKSDKDCDNPR